MFTLQQIVIKIRLLKICNYLEIQKVNPGFAYSINLLNFNIFKFSYLDNNKYKKVNFSNPKPIIDVTPQSRRNIMNSGSGYIDYRTININIPDHFRNIFDKRFNAIMDLKRCERCILPETFPYIKFNNSGVCNYCENNKTKIKPKNKDQLINTINKYKNSNDLPDCIVPFSGGRDSSYGLYYLKEKLGMNPISFTYDWGMVTDLARRNIARVCGELGVENIIISADIKRKRENIKKNVIAWLKEPDLGIIPLFMAGDKQFFYYLNKIKKQTGIKLNIWMGNRLEETDFKTAFCNIKPNHLKDRIDELTLHQK